MDLKDILTEENAKKVASYVVEYFISEANSENLDFDFDIQQGKMVKTNLANTYFRFDTQEDTLLRKIKDAITSRADFVEELEISEKDIDIESILMKDVEIMDNFKNKVSEYISLRSDDLKNTIRRVVLNNAHKEIFPLNTCEVKTFEIGELPEEDCVIVVEKLSPKNIQSGSVSLDLMKEFNETRKDLNEIIEQKKKEGNELYRYVKSAYRKKHFFECYLDLYVDYSVGRLPIVK